jgi:hypothetical protein
MSGNWPPPQGGAPEPGNWPPPQGQAPQPGTWQQPSQPPPYWQQPPHPDDKLLAWAIPINRSGLAIAAGYVALLTLPILVVGPVAVLLGILALGDIKRHPGKLGKGRSWFAIIYGGLGTLLLVYALSFLIPRGT